VGIWGSSASDVYAVGSSVILHYDGNSWKEVILCGVNDGAGSIDIGDVGGTSSSDVFVVGGKDVVLHYDGTSWTKMTLPAGSDWRLCGVWGSTEGDVLAVGSSGIAAYSR